MALTGTILGAVGITLALLMSKSLFDMFWGKPKLAVNFALGEFNRQQVIVCSVNNEPLTGIMAFLASREPAYIRVSFRILELESRKIIEPELVPLLESGQGARTEIITLPPTIRPAYFYIMYKPIETAKALIYYSDGRCPHEFEAGEYEVRVEIQERDKPMIKSQKFIIESQTYNLLLKQN